MLIQERCHNSNDQNKDSGPTHTIYSQSNYKNWRSDSSKIHHCKPNR